MSNEDYDVLAEAYADYECGFSKHKGKKLQQLHEDKIIEFYDVLGFLIERFCIVPKDAIKDTYNNFADKLTDKFHLAAQERTIIHASIASALVHIFGKELFNKEKK